MENFIFCAAFFWLINCNLKAINMTKPKLTMVRPWSPLRKLQKVHK